MRKESQRGSTRNAVLLAAVLLINALVIGFGGMYLWRNRKKEEKDIASKKAAAEAVLLATSDATPPVAPVVETPSTVKTRYFKQVVPFEGVLTNMAGDNGRRILRMNLEVEFEGEGVLKEVEKLKPQLRDAILNSASELDYNEAAKPEAREKFKQKIIYSINELLTTGKAIGIYFTEFQTN